MLKYMKNIIACLLRVNIDREMIEEFSREKVF